MNNLPTAPFAKIRYDVYDRAGGYLVPHDLLRFYFFIIKLSYFSVMFLQRDPNDLCNDETSQWPLFSGNLESDLIRKSFLTSENSLKLRPGCSSRTLSSPDCGGY